VTPPAPSATAAESPTPISAARLKTTELQIGQLQQQ